MHNWYKELSEVDVNDYIDKKNGLSYLRWMWAWHTLKTRYPLSYSTVHETEDGMIVWKDPVGCHVKTSVTIVWFETEKDENGNDKEVRHEHTVTEYLPCMDLRNQSIPYDKVDSMAANKTVQRSLTKCIARLGLGDYLYMNEEMTEDASKTLELKERIKAIATKKAALSDKAKERVKTLCIEAEKLANPELAEDLISGNYNNIDNVEILENLEKNLLAVRK